MILNEINIFAIAITWICLINLSWTNTVKAEPALQDYCMQEIFQPRCVRNEVILMKSAIYGRMKIGRCLTAEEVDAHRLAVGEDPRYFGCSADVLHIMDRKCSGKAECEARWSDVSSENIKPCFPGLTAYLEVSYECINDGDRSCTVTAGKSPAYLLSGSIVSQVICGTKSQPWNLEAPIGQKINISLFDFTTSGSNIEKSKHHCRSHGLIVDKSAKRNASLCVNGERREKTLYLSAGNVVQIMFDASIEQPRTDTGVQFMLKVEAVGCSDIVPPDDTWLKRNDDSIVIGCYSSRQTWRLSCNGGNWNGVLGNCSKDNGHSARDSNTESENESAVVSDKQVIAIVAIGGFTLTVCLVIVCSGAVYLRRFYVQYQKKQDYKTLHFNGNSTGSQLGGQHMPLGVPGTTSDSDTNFVLTQEMPMYSVYAGQNNMTNADNLVRAKI